MTSIPQCFIKVYCVEGIFVHVDHFVSFYRFQQTWRNKENQEKCLGEKQGNEMNSEQPYLSCEHSYFCNEIELLFWPFLLTCELTKLMLETSSLAMVMVKMKKTMFYEKKQTHKKMSCCQMINSGCHIQLHIFKVEFAFTGCVSSSFRLKKNLDIVLQMFKRVYWLNTAFGPIFLTTSKSHSSKPELNPLIELWIALYFLAFLVFTRHVLAVMNATGYSLFCERN